MQLNLSTDYALRIVSRLMTTPGAVSTAVLANELGISRSYLMKVLKKLKYAGIIDTERGFSGGCYLALKPEDINFKIVFEAMDDNVVLNRCLEPDSFCSRNAVETCVFHAFYEDIQKYLDEKFNSSIMSVVENYENN